MNKSDVIEKLYEVMKPDKKYRIIVNIITSDITLKVIK